ncbi:MAG: hypothetical protein MUF36_02430 [Bacteroidales bacterium]|jgi:hypothetical protein|nr:hypothetical protein [Bacteroidales bacterium]
MGLNFTPFLSYREIKTDKIDLFEDAFGINAQFSDVIGLLNMVKPVPGKRLTHRLIRNIKKSAF